MGYDAALVGIITGQFFDYPKDGRRKLTRNAWKILRVNRAFINFCS